MQKLLGTSETNLEVLERDTEKRIIAMECVTLLSVLPRFQLLNIELEWLTRKQLRRLYKEIKNTFADKC